MRHPGQPITWLYGTLDLPPSPNMFCFIGSDWRAPPRDGMLHGHSGDTEALSSCDLPSPHPSRWVACSCPGFRQGLSRVVCPLTSMKIIHKVPPFLQRPSPQNCEVYNSERIMAQYPCTTQTVEGEGLWISDDGLPAHWMGQSLQIQLRY